jgi:hypothetical protein
VEGKIYIPTPYLREVATTLILEGFDLGFISGGGESRNYTLLDRIKINQAASLKDVAKIISAHQLYDVPNVDPKEYFSNRKKKDFSKYGVPEANIAHADDTIFFVFNETQAKSFIHVTGTTLYIEDYEKWLATNPPDNVYNPKSKRSHILEKAKLVWMLGIVLSAKADWLKHGGEYRDWVYKHSHNADGTTLDRDHEDSIKYFERGAKAIENTVDVKKGLSFQFLRHQLYSLPGRCAGIAT